MLAFTMLAPPAPSIAAGTGTLVLKTASGDHSFNIEVMVTDQERALGLMFRRSLPENGGMLFIYDPPQPATMWMRNTLIPLDMVFISADARVHRIEFECRALLGDSHPFRRRRGGGVGAERRRGR